MISGIYTALVTPMRVDGQLDSDGLEQLVEFQLQSGVSGLVPVGTTGESSTLCDDERRQVVERTCRQVTDRADIFVGAGSNSTAHAMEYCAHAAASGARGVLLVDPYYNGPSSLEIRREYLAPIARRFSQLELIPYIVPGRTGTQLEAQDLALLAEEFANISAVKEASTAENAALIRRCCGSDLAILSGEDSINLHLMQRADIAASGAISVVANVAPAALQHMVEHALAGRWTEAEKLSTALAPLCAITQLETQEATPLGPVRCRARNPLPIKILMHLLGLPAGPCRRPLGRLTRAGFEQVRHAVRRVLIIDASVLEPIEHFFDVDIEARLADEKLAANLVYADYADNGSQAAEQYK